MSHLRIYCISLFTCLLHLGFATNLKISGSTPEIELFKAMPGEDLQSETNASTLCTMHLDCDHGFLTAQLLEKMPEGTKLTMQIQAPSVVKNHGQVDLSLGDEQRLISAIPSGKYEDLLITYRFSGSIESGLISDLIQNIVIKLYDHE